MFKTFLNSELRFEFQSSITNFFLSQINFIKDMFIWLRVSNILMTIENFWILLPYL